MTRQSPAVQMPSNEDIRAELAEIRRSIEVARLASLEHAIRWSSVADAVARLEALVSGEPRGRRHPFHAFAVGARRLAAAGRADFLSGTSQQTDDLVAQLTGQNTGLRDHATDTIRNDLVTDTEGTE